MLITFIQDLLRRNIEEDVREPSLNLLIPGLGTLGITYPHLIFWVQLTAVRIPFHCVESAGSSLIHLLSSLDYCRSVGLQCVGRLLYVLCCGQTKRLHSIYPSRLQSFAGIGHIPVSYRSVPRCSQHCNGGRTIWVSNGGILSLFDG